MSSSGTILISKSRFLAGLQCPLRLWYQVYHPEFASIPTPAQQALFEAGHEVGRLAAQLYSGGVLIEEDHLHHREAVRKTAGILKNSSIPAIYEAGFLFDGVRVRTDILERVSSKKWNLIEVKSSSSLNHKDYYLWDLAIQYYVLEGAGLQVEKAGLMNLNREYLYPGGPVDLNQLFKLNDFSEEVSSLKDQVRWKIEEQKEVLSGKEAPRINPSRFCNRPYGCEFQDHCTRDKPEFWVLRFYGIAQNRLDQLEALGIEDIRDIPETFHLTGIQERIWRCIVHQKEYFSPDLKRELEDFEYPVHFLDFETVGPAIPRYPYTRPYQTVPFQWSDHILYPDGKLAHYHYLCQEDKDPREDFARTLAEVLEDKGSIVIYTNYEVGIIQELAGLFSRYKRKLMASLDRMKDLCALIRKHYYHPRFYGSFSLKSVLPALIPEMDYKNLAIKEGNQASLMYLKMLDPATSNEERERIKNELLTYCGHDTLAMVRIREELIKKG
jgi:hypothetical protein